jgi:hypothetical protein
MTTLDKQIEQTKFDINYLKGELEEMYYGDGSYSLIEGTKEKIKRLEKRLETLKTEKQSK